MRSPSLPALALCLLAGGYVAAASSSSTCVRVRSQPEAWVGSSVDALVAAAHAAYEDDEALPAYEKKLGGISDTIRRCELSRDERFASRYRELIDYVETAALDLHPDHELGFAVPDRQYFAETRELVQIPGFLRSRSFLHAVSRPETLPRAKEYLRQAGYKGEPIVLLTNKDYTSMYNAALVVAERATTSSPCAGIHHQDLIS